MLRSLRQHSFTIIEYTIVIVIIVILATVVASTYSGVQAKNRNNQREAAIDAIQKNLEVYYADNNNSRYPTLANLSDPAWVAANLKQLDPGNLRDPRWSKTVAACTANGHVTPSNAPATDCYAYQVTAADGAACDNQQVICAHYTLTAMLEGGGKYVKSSLN